MSYTLITGASAGIGEVFAKQLAEQGQNLILSARRKEKLDALAAELSQQYKVKVETVSADLANSAGSEELATAILDKGLAVNGLINNAGFGDRGLFSDLPLDRQIQMIQLNVTSLVDLTHRLLPTIRQQKNAFIINVASTAAFQAGPNMAIYYATKAFVLSFSEALHEELKKDNIAVSTLCPGATESEFAQEANMTNTKLFKAGAMTAEEVVRKSLKKKHKAIVITGSKNILAFGLVKYLPDRLPANWQDGYKLKMCLIKQRAANAEQKALRRQQILLATKQRFSVSAYEDVNLNHIAADVGITKAALYRYFRNKETLFLALYVESLELLITSSEAIVTQESLTNAISDELIKHPIFCKLSAILHTILERNLNHDEALAFKLTLLELLKKFAHQIQQHPEAVALNEQDIFRLLMQVQQALIGVWHMTHPNGAIAEVLEKQPLRIFKQDFEETLKAHLKQLFSG